MWWLPPGFRPTSLPARRSHTSNFLIFLLFILRKIRLILASLSCSEGNGNLSLWVKLGSNAEMEDERVRETYCAICSCCLMRTREWWAPHMPPECDQQEGIFPDLLTLLCMPCTRNYRKAPVDFWSFSLVLTGKFIEWLLILLVVLWNWTEHWNGTSSFNCWPKNFNYLG